MFIVTYVGVLNHEELFLINRGFRKVESNESLVTPQKYGKGSKAATDNGGTACSQSTAFCK